MLIELCVFFLLLLLFFSAILSCFRRSLVRLFLLVFSYIPAGKEISPDCAWSLPVLFHLAENSDRFFHTNEKVSRSANCESQFFHFNALLWLKVARAALFSSITKVKWNSDERIQTFYSAPFQLFRPFTPSCFTYFL